MSDCCPSHEHNHEKAKKIDKIFWTAFPLVAIFYLASLISLPVPMELHHLFHSTFDMMNKMWLGIFLGAFFVGVLDFVPRDLVMSILGQGNGIKGLFRATLAGLFLDLCSHGILMVGIKLYERGARIGQVMAFLVASPWNSLSLTFILMSLIGIKWTLIFILMSAVIAILTGIVFDWLVGSGKIIENPHTQKLPEGYSFKAESKKLLKQVSYNPKDWAVVFWLGLKQSKPILKWLLVGVLVAAAMQAFIEAEVLQKYMGPSLLGLGVSLVFATIIEVCSEGTTPIAADIFNRANAPGNAFAFLMTGVSTDYTEIMAIKESTKSWKIALFLPLVTIPQIVIIAIIMNSFN